MAKKINTFGSVCSGIEAASFVLEPFGVTPLWLSEIADFPKKFLKYQYPTIKNIGDMNDIPQMIDKNSIECPDLLCGGTPCQAFSLAGWKNGLNDDRGQLTLKYIDILNSIDRKRKLKGLSRTLFFWENVEGVLKDKTNAFGFFLAGLLDLENPVVCLKWPNAGAIYGKERNIAWRILDAKYFGIPQQRKRLYVIGGGTDFDPVSILFEKGKNISDPYLLLTANDQPTLFDDYTHSMPKSLKRTINGHEIEVFRHYSDCLYAAYGTKWNGNAAAFNGSLFICQDGRIRRLTPKECERLMGFPDDYTNISPNIRVTNRYQAIGNSWAVPVISWIMNRIVNQIKDEITIPRIALKQENPQFKLYALDGFVRCTEDWINASTYPYDYKLTHLLDIVDTDVEDKYYLSPAGCAGIIRRKIERNAKINERLELHLRNGFKDNPDLMHKKKQGRHPNSQDVH